ncbi:hypothetical protein GCM10009765_61550 [Fodinicola feengrottensis]|uniref:SWIM-type domain-containing protein n=1 Tax=Fodinicola feengrottensis TaxID=435914 RepID=A0ABN2IFP0_9ACTN
MVRTLQIAPADHVVVDRGGVDESTRRVCRCPLTRPVPCRHEHRVFFVPSLRNNSEITGHSSGFLELNAKKLSVRMICTLAVRVAAQKKAAPLRQEWGGFLGRTRAEKLSVVAAGQLSLIYRRRRDGSLTGLLQRHEEALGSVA